MLGRGWVQRTCIGGALLCAATVTSNAEADATATLAVEPSKADRAEDGRGHTVDASAPRGLVLHSPAGWPARALDPVLYIGSLHFHHYTHVDRTTLRFELDDVARLSEGDIVYVQYGDDAQSRVRLDDLGAVR
ncbi:MAG: hypothetical protein AAGA54_13005 [Myxococcota bacterium]